jgi:hypothetical protein
MRTQLIHGAGDGRRWDCTHHLVPPMSASVASRPGTVHRGAPGFAEFATAEAALDDEAPIYIYDRLDEPTRGMLEGTLAYAEGGGIRGLLRQWHGCHQCRARGHHPGGCGADRPSDAVRLVPTAC